MCAISQMHLKRGENMGRPPKVRCVEMIPPVRTFCPCGNWPECRAHRGADERIEMTVDEMEAIRLKDLEGCEQTECADRMNISRGTFQRILSSARWKVAKALTEGLILQISGGEYCLAKSTIICLDCGHAWPVCRPNADSKDECEETVTAEDGTVSGSCPECRGTNLVEKGGECSGPGGREDCPRRRERGRRGCSHRSGAEESAAKSTD